MKKQVTFIKLGGSIITNKEVPMMVQTLILKRLITELVKARKKTDDVYVVGHGQGSFAHAPAMRYKTKDGFVSSDSVIGMAITQDSAAQLNRIVVNNCISQQLPAVSFLFSNSMVTKNKEANHWCKQVFLQYLEKELLPITGGDVIVDEEMGCTIWSTEKVLSYLALTLPKDRYEVKRIIHVTQVDGVLGEDNSVVNKITNKNKNKVKKYITATKGFDVTGGMWHKIEESLELVKHNIDSYIISGLKINNLYNCLMNKNFIGTKITK